MTSADGTSIVVSFDGKLDGDAGAASAAAFAEALRRGPADVVWDLRRMSGYETSARIAWQNALWPHRHHIRKVEVIGGGPLVRLGAMTLTAVLGVPVRFSD